MEDPSTILGLHPLEVQICSHTPRFRRRIRLHPMPVYLRVQTIRARKILVPVATNPQTEHLDVLGASRFVEAPLQPSGLEA